MRFLATTRVLSCQPCNGYSERCAESVGSAFNKRRDGLFIANPTRRGSSGLFPRGAEPRVQRAGALRRLAGAVRLAGGAEGQRKIRKGLGIARTESGGVGQGGDRGVVALADQRDRAERVPRLRVLRGKRERFLFEPFGFVQVVSRVGDGGEIVPGAKLPRLLPQHFAQCLGRSIGVADAQPRQR